MSTAFYQIAIMAAGLVAPRIMLSYYGSEINGLVSSITQFIVYFNLVEAGLSGAAIYSLYKPLAEKNYKAINAIVVAAKKFYTKSGYIFISLTVGLAAFYPLYVKTDSLTPLNVSILVIVLSANGILEFFTLAKYRVLLSADQRTYVISLASLLHIVVNTLVIVILGTRQVDIVVLRTVALLSIFLRSLVLMVYTKRKYKYLNYKEKPDNQSLSRRWDALYLQVLGAIHSGAPVLILTMLTKNLKLVSVYTVFNMVIGAINGILSIFISGLSASFGDVIARGETPVLQKAYKEFEFAYYVLITAVYSIAFVTIMPFVRIYTLGVVDIKYDLPLIGFLFVLNGLLFNIKTPQGMLVISAGLFRETRVQTTIQGAIAVFGGIVLTYFFGIAGVLVASILSNLYRDIDLIIFISKNITMLPIKNTIFRVIRMCLSILIIFIPFFFIELTPTGYISWAIDGIIVGVYVSFVLLVFNLVFERKAMGDVVKRIIGMIKS